MKKLCGWRRVKRGRLHCELLFVLLGWQDTLYSFSYRLFDRFALLIRVLFILTMCFCFLIGCLTHFLYLLTLFIVVIAYLSICFFFLFDDWSLSGYLFSYLFICCYLCIYLFIFCSVWWLEAQWTFFFLFFLFFFSSNFVCSRLVLFLHAHRWRPAVLVLFGRKESNLVWEMHEKDEKKW